METEVEVDKALLHRLSSIEWLRRCGENLVKDLQFPVTVSVDITSSVQTVLSAEWVDVGTAAQGELTRFLAVANYNLYGTTWNRLGDEIEAVLRTDIMPQVDDGLARLGAESLSDKVLLDLCRIMLWASYKKRFPRVPEFFGQLLQVYAAGHLPCGWIGDLNEWPKGELVVY